MPRRLKESTMRALVFTGLALVVTLLNHRAAINVLARTLSSASAGREGSSPTARPELPQVGVIQTIKATPRDIRSQIPFEAVSTAAGASDPVTADFLRAAPPVAPPAARGAPPSLRSPAYLQAHRPGRLPAVLSPPA